MHHLTVQPALVNLVAGDLEVFDLRRCVRVVWAERDRPHNPITAYKSRNKGVGVQFTTWPFWWTYWLDTCFRLEDAQVALVVELLPPEGEQALLAANPLPWQNTGQ